LQDRKLAGLQKLGIISHPEHEMDAELEAAEESDRGCV